MRTYACHVSAYVDDVLFKSENSACWSMLQSPQYFKSKMKKPIILLGGNEIYISEFKDEQTSKYRDLLVTTINEITPCSVVDVNGIEYIKFATLRTYDQSLILLNFIRNLWHEPIKGYSEAFFVALEKANPEDDPLAKLTWANKEACDSKTYSVGHSNIHKKGDLVVKTTKELLSYEGNTTRGFLTGK